MRRNVGDVRGHRQPESSRGSIAAPGSIEDSDYQSAFDRLADVWHDAAGIAQDAGVRMVWEFEPGFAFNKPSEVVALHQKVGHPNFFVMFDTSHAYMCAVVGARQHGAKETLPGGVAEFLEKLKGRIGAIHLIDSDGTLHGDETSTHRPFRRRVHRFPPSRRNCWTFRRSSGGASTCVSGRDRGNWWSRACDSFAICWRTRAVA